MIDLADGNKIDPTDEMVVECETHNFKTTWGKLDPIQQLAFESNLDVEGDVCIMDNPRG